MNAPRILTAAEINGKQVAFFSPPHSEPDFPWVDVEELAKAFLPRSAAKRMVQHAHRFSREEGQSTATARNGNKIVTIIPHAMAQGLCGAIDQWNGFVKNDDDTGPAHDAYCTAAGHVAAEHWPLSLGDMIRAFHNPGGPFLKGFREA